MGQLVHWSAELMMQLPADDQLTICQGKQHQHTHTHLRCQSFKTTHLCTSTVHYRCERVKNSARRQRVLRYFQEADIQYGGKTVHIVFKYLSRARIFKLLRSPRIDSKEKIPPGCEVRLVGTTTLFLLGSYSPHSLFKNSSTEACSRRGWGRAE